MKTPRKFTIEWEHSGYKFVPYRLPDNGFQICQIEASRQQSHSTWFTADWQCHCCSFDNDIRQQWLTAATKYDNNGRFNIDNALCRRGVKLLTTIGTSQLLVMDVLVELLTRSLEEEISKDYLLYRVSSWRGLISEHNRPHLQLLTAPLLLSFMMLTCSIVRL